MRLTLFSQVKLVFIQGCFKADPRPGSSEDWDTEEAIRGGAQTWVNGGSDGEGI
ncbi:hypothetical protein DPMN_029008 [Dreissena polymorpha]|uniref:Uncharacterized protein n=1 Tax=Dreissena polymorpha TaxID=45954 RepID=A0A9D4LXC2_DREPO|nr:hypothetical protein DPMN_029008 [Dreissena polymorpha]